MPLSYLFNDGDIFAVYKPAGAHSVQLRKGGGWSIADELLRENPSLAQASEKPGDAGLVNRLDEETSGILLGATSRSVWEKLYKQALHGEVHKKYAMLVEGRVTKDFSLTSFIGTPNRGAHKVKVYEKRPPSWARALEGTTKYTPHQHIPLHNVTILLASASPARRHQVRAHAAHLGVPLIGDALYGSTRALPPIVKSSRRFFLHAYYISFRHPIFGKEVVVEAPFEAELTLPQDAKSPPSAS
jgi:23S rRNA-/tRNA-specific pseudouridylate synthase